MTFDASNDESTSKPFTADEACARRLDAEDPLAGYRERFFIPKNPTGGELVYFAGNSLGLQPTSTRALLDQELRDWAELGVEGHFHAKTPWYTYHETCRETGARLVGARPEEVVIMNSLTVNLHLMMATFYRPTASRHKIVIEAAAFPSDIYAVKTQLRFHGYDPSEALYVVKPRPGEYAIRTEDIADMLERHGGEIALVAMSGVNYFTGQMFDIPRITSAAKQQGCVVGFDLAHAVGNVPLQLHDWNVDFAVWCNYKYLNGGPGAIGGCFVHENHGHRTDLPRLGGWWGNDPKTRFRMHLEPEFIPQPGADGWQISNPSLFALAPVRASYDLFDEVGMAALRRKSVRLTAYLEFLIDDISPERFEVITPRDPAQRGCQLSMLINDRPHELLKALKADGVICDFREPNVVRVAPVPFYNTFHEVWRFARILARHDRTR